MPRGMLSSAREKAERSSTQRAKEAPHDQIQVPEHTPELDTMLGPREHDLEQGESND